MALSPTHRTAIRPRFGAPALLALTLFTLPLLHQPAQANDRPRTLVLRGEGTVSARPDMASISLGVVTNGDTAKVALDRNTAAMTKVFRVLETNKVPGRDVQTSGFRVQPVFKRQPRGSSSTGPVAPEIIGYTVRNQVTVAVRDLDNLGTLIDALVSDGANEFQGLTFGFSDPEPLLDNARRAAAEDVQRKANLYAEALGITLGPIQTVSEQSGGRVRPRAVALERVSGDVPVSAGESELSISISVTYNLMD